MFAIITSQSQANAAPSSFKKSLFSLRNALGSFFSLAESVVESLNSEDSAILSIGLDHHVCGYSTSLSSSIPSSLANYLTHSLGASTFTDFSSSLDAPSVHTPTATDIDLFQATFAPAELVEDEEAYDWGFPEDDSPFPALSSSSSSSTASFPSVVHFEPLFGSDSGSDSG